MPFLDNLFGPHLNNLQFALSRAAHRHSLLSTNLANVNTPGYKRRDLDFNIALQEEIERTPPRLGDWRDRKRQQDENGTSIRVDGNNVDLEHEVMSLAETELRYQALADFTSEYFGGLKNVIREGR